MPAHWIVTANASRARFFAQTDAGAPLQEINDMVNEAVRLRELETEHDKLGPTSATKSIHNTGGALPNKTYEPHQTPDEHQTELFARDVAGYLLRAHQEGQFAQLSLAASPQFLGVLRSLLDASLQSAIAVEINKDYTQSAPGQLLEQIESQKGGRADRPA